MAVLTNPFEAGLQIARNATEQTWSDVLTRVYRHGRHTKTAFDAQMRAPPPDLNAAEGPEETSKVLRGHDLRIVEPTLICLGQ